MVSKAFRCDRCKALIEDEVAALYPSLATGYGEDSVSIRIEIHRTDYKADFCEPCVRAIVTAFLKEKSAPH
jgi:hypothetical protein